MGAIVLVALGLLGSLTFVLDWLGSRRLPAPTVESTSAGPYRVPRAIPPPPRPGIVLPLLAALLCASLAVFTSRKLDTMAMLRGERPGSPERELTVQSVSELGRNTWLFILRDPQTQATYRLQARSHQLERLETGSTVRVRCLDDDCYFADSVYIEDGNVAFDRGLLAVELAGFVAALGYLGLQRRRWRDAWRALARPSQ